jgi:predicted transcriptional regulator
MYVYKTIKIPIDAREFGRSLRDLRRKDGRSVQTLATHAEVSHAYWYELEKGEVKHLDETRLRRIEKVMNHDFGVNFDGNN